MKRWSEMQHRNVYSSHEGCIYLKFKLKCSLWHPWYQTSVFVNPLQTSNLPCSFGWWHPLEVRFCASTVILHLWFHIWYPSQTLPFDASCAAKPRLLCQHNKSIRGSLKSSAPVPGVIWCSVENLQATWCVLFERPCLPVCACLIEQCGVDMRVSIADSLPRTQAYLEHDDVPHASLIFVLTAGSAPSHTHRVATFEQVWPSGNVCRTRLLHQPPFNRVVCLTLRPECLL